MYKYDQIGCGKCGRPQMSSKEVCQTFFESLNAADYQVFFTGMSLPQAAMILM